MVDNGFYDGVSPIGPDSMTSEPDNTSEADQGNRESDAWQTSMPMSSKLASGLAWILGQNLANKLFALLGQLILVRLLLPEAFGTVGLVYTVTRVLGVYSQNGVREVLIQRQKQFDDLMLPATQLVVFMGFLAAIGIAVIGPVFSIWVYKDPDMLPLIFMMLPVPLMNGLSNLFEARLQAELRFNIVAIVNSITAFVHTASIITLALIGLGAASLIVGMLCGALLRLVILTSMTRPGFSLRPCMDRIRSLFLDSIMLMGNGLLQILGRQAGTFILGVFHSTTIVGYYFFAMSLTIQIILPLTATTGSVFLPILSRISDQRDRYHAAFRKILGCYTVLIMPLTLCLSVSSIPLFNILFPADWQQAAAVFAVLLIGESMACMSVPGVQGLKSQGQFSVLWKFQLVQLILAVVLMSIGGFLGEALAVAIGLTVSRCLMAPVSCMILMRVIGGRAREVFQEVAIPIGSGVVSFAAAGLAAYMVPWNTLVDGWMVDLLQLVLIVLIGFPGYLILMLVFQRRSIRDLMELGRPILLKLGLGGSTDSGNEDRLMDT